MKKILTKARNHMKEKDLKILILGDRTKKKCTFAYNV